MPIEYLKKATPPQEAIDNATSETVQRRLADIQKNGRDAVEKYARDFDGWNGSIVVSEDQFAAATRKLSQGVKDDTAIAHARVKDFAVRQRESLHEFEVELIDGLIAGQKLIPVNTAGCYVPGGRYAHAASVIMGVCTAKVAGVPNIVATSPGHKEAGVNPAILHTMKLCGAHTALPLGGVQGIAAMAFGLYSAKPADVIVGPGNRFVAEAKRTLFGRIGIDVVAAPTESAIEVMLVGSREEMVRISDQYAPEHLQVFAEDLDWWLEHLTNYGSLFLGEETTVAYGPLEFMPRLTEALGGPNLHIKRDDCTGLGTGGNKTRKLAFLMADAVKHGADAIITQGATQSNHARQTVAIAAKMGMKCEILLEDRTGSKVDNDKQSGNVFLDHLYGANVQELPGRADMNAAMAKRADELRAKGQKPYSIPGGGSNAIGALGYVVCALEMVDQFNNLGLNVNCIAHERV